MQQEDIFKKICEEYDLGKNISSEKIIEGKLNNNYALKTTRGKYFVKIVREKMKDKLEMIYKIESLMKSRGIPAISMLKTKNREIFVSLNGEICTLYPFIENKKQKEFSKNDYFLIGEILGQIHVAGKENIPHLLEIKQFSRPTDNTIIEKLTKYKNDIENKENKGGIDKLFIKYINFKLNTIPKIEKITLPNNNIIHGDYHFGNILMDENRDIVGIIDWEKTEYAPRAYELARSFFYNCYSDGYNSEKVLDFSKSFFEGYLSKIDMDKKEILDGLYMRTHRMALSSWIEDSYYLRSDHRSLDLIEHEMHLVDLFVNKNLLKQIKSFLFNNQF